MLSPLCPLCPLRPLAAQVALLAASLPIVWRAVVAMDWWVGLLSA